MDAIIQFEKVTDRFQNSLLSTVEHFRKGEDHLGLVSLKNMLEDLEIVLELHYYSGELMKVTDKIITYLQKLNFYMQNKDVVGMTDLLEFEIHPLTKEWF